MLNDRSFLSNFETAPVVLPIDSIECFGDDDQRAVDEPGRAIFARRRPQPEANKFCIKQTRR
jgi:hypothetical protein